MFVYKMVMNDSGVLFNLFNFKKQNRALLVHSAKVFILMVNLMDGKRAKKEAFSLNGQFNEWNA